MDRSGDEIRDIKVKSFVLNKKKGTFDYKSWDDGISASILDAIKVEHIFTL